MAFLKSFMDEHMSQNMASSFFSLKSARTYRTRLAWSVWFVTTAFVLLQFFLQLSSGEIIAGLMKSFSLTAFGGGVLASSYYYIYVLLQTPAGMLIDRYGARGILSISALNVCIGSLLFAASKIVVIALLGRILMGIGAAFAFVGCLNLIATWFPAIPLRASAVANFCSVTPSLHRRGLGPSLLVPRDAERSRVLMVGDFPNSRSIA